MVALLKMASKGKQACTEALSTISSIVSDLETTAMFAAAGALNSVDGSTGSFFHNRVEILSTAKTIVDGTKQLIRSVGSQEQLAQAAQAVVVTISQMAEAVTLAAIALGSDNLEAQVIFSTNSFRSCHGY